MSPFSHNFTCNLVLQFFSLYFYLGLTGKFDTFRTPKMSGLLYFAYLFTVGIFSFFMGLKRKDKDEKSDNKKLILIGCSVVDVQRLEFAYEIDL